MTTEFKPLDPSSFGPPKQDAVPKRGRGRPRGSGGRPRKSLVKEIEGLISLLNSVARIGAPKDALDSVEVATLAKAIDEEAKRSPRFRKALETLLAASGGTSLGMVIGIIIGRRMARHNLFGVPSFVDDIGASALQMMNVSPSEADEAMASIVGMMGFGNDASTPPASD